ncbi:sarcosine oxidase subunit gamma [uncultured Ruegeria sp.]|uniref:sarcosine oxidase subunit gamma n=1 Tax=uncultured Ruegeria sp. TaxID=259304 RepID=UPI00262ADD56|nr:sarcosine oxidase subunit gamma [uncultured Ruegeria sp.]
MHDLIALTALGGTGPESCTVGSVSCRECPDIALASVAARLGHEAETRAALATLTGHTAPDIEQTSGQTVKAFWTGPDQWMLEAPFETHEDLASVVKRHVKDAASVSEQTDAWTRFDLEAPDVQAVLELLCNLDCRKMAPGAAARTSIHHLGCFVLCRSANVFSIYGPRSSARSLQHAIIAAMNSAL